MKAKEKITTTVLCLVLLTAYIVIFGVYTNYISTTREEEMYSRLNEISYSAAEITWLQISSEFQSLTSLADLISHQEYGTEDNFMDFLSSEVEKNNFKRMGVINEKGIAHLSDGPVLDFSDREYYKLAMDGVASISDTLTDKVDGQKIIVSCAPIIDNGISKGALFATNDIDVLKQRLAVTSYGGEGKSFIIKNDGTPIVLTTAADYFDNFFNYIWGDNPIENNEISKKVYTDMQNGNGGSVFFDGPTGEKYMCYQPVGVNDWYSCTVIPSQYINGKIKETILITGLLEVMSIGLILVFMLYIVMLKTKKQNELKHIAFTDKLTGFGNWNKLKNDADRLIGEEQAYAMIIMDIDEFKMINDLYGYKYGNNVLITCANAINGIICESETFARNTADTFNIIMKYNSNEEIIERIREIETVVSESALSCKVKFSFGVFIIDDIDHAISTYSDRANLAKKTIKGRVDTNIAFYNDKAREQILLEHEIENDMEQALKDNQFKVYLQPKIEFKTGKLVGAEALVRWVHPCKGIIPPYKFIPFFEKNGFITKLDLYMFEQVCRLLNEWNYQDGFRTNIAVSVNLSRIHLNNPNIVNDLLSIVKKYGVPTSSLEIELTESAIFDNMKSLIVVMHALKKAGFKISIDDFGSGYSSLNLLKDIPADILKIDKAFLDTAANNDRAKKIIHNVVNMARDLGLVTVAEGVETIEQVEFLTKIGCDIAQGYFYARPMPVNEFEVRADEMHEKQNNPAGDDI